MLRDVLDQPNISSPLNPQSKTGALCGAIYVHSRCVKAASLDDPGRRGLAGSRGSGGCSEQCRLPRSEKIRMLCQVTSQSGEAYLNLLLVSEVGCSLD